MLHFLYHIIVQLACLFMPCHLYSAADLSSRGFVDLSGGSTSSLPLRSSKEMQFDDYNSPFVARKDKLVLCWFPKNACTKWKSLVFRLIHGNDPSPMNVHRMHSQFETLGKLSINDTQHIFTSSDWVRVVTVRDPIERLIAGYLEKLVTGKRTSLLSKLGRKTLDPSLEDFTFFLSHSSTWKKDTHFAPQSKFCGLTKSFRNWNFIVYHQEETLDFATY